MLDGLSCWVLTDGKIGDRVQCLGLAESLNLSVEERLANPRPPWSWWAPWGPPDPREPIGPRPFPAIAIASGRRTVPVLRALKRASGGRTFTVFLKEPANGACAADLIWVPEHDRLRGPNVIVTLTSPSRLTPAGLAAARADPDRRLAALPRPRVAMVLGGPSVHHRFDPAMMERLVGIARQLMGAGHGLMVTPSRRTPPRLLAALAALSGEGDFGTRLFVWRGEEPNPYTAMLGLADAVIVTGDSVNMVGEAALTGAPIHVVEPPGGHPKTTAFIDRLVQLGVARRWAGCLECFTYGPIDATPAIATAVAARFAAFRKRLGTALP